jgi:UDP-N-acetylglucosamine enolpyruvyl transferase
MGVNPYSTLKQAKTAPQSKNTRLDAYPLAKVIHTASYSYPLGQLLYKTEKLWISVPNGCNISDRQVIDPMGFM